MGEPFFELSAVGPVQVVSLNLPQTLDSREFDRLNEDMLTLLGDKPEARWVLDLSALSYMGSSVLGLMVNIRQRVKQAGGRLVLCGLSPRLHQIFRTCCMERLFHIARGRDEALKIVNS